MSDPYAKLLPYYDAENAGFDDDLYFYLSLVEEGRVLDLGCGTGRLALPLAQHGFEIVGVDRSAAMLKRAKQRAASLGIEAIHWREAEVTELALGEQFDLVMFSYNGFFHLRTREAQRKTLRMMAAHTAPDGLMVLDLSNPLNYIRSDEAHGFVVERSFTDERGYDVIQQTLTTLDRASQMMDVTYIYDYTDENGLLRRDTVPMHFRLVTALELELLIEMEVKSPLEFFGNYDGQPYEEDSSRLIAVIGEM